MTSEARAILCALDQGLNVNPFHYSPRAWLILIRYRRRYSCCL